jgi:plasmid stabilization system protein ParE
LRELDEPSIREILFGSYRIIYRAKTDIVEILTVYHGARLLDPDRLK